jgi:hypothetical protein
MPRPVIITAALAAAVTVLPAVALAEERTCRGTIGARTVDNVRVPDGASCTLEGTRVKGTVKVETNARLVARGVRVVGNVQGENAARVVVRAGSRVGGSVQVKQGGGALVAGSRVTHDVQYDSNTRRVRIVRTRVGGNVQLVGNRGGAEVTNNRIDENLQCKENSPAPVGGGNRVGNNKEDQCARL